MFKCEWKSYLVCLCLINLVLIPICSTQNNFSDTSNYSLNNHIMTKSSIKEYLEDFVEFIKNRFLGKQSQHAKAYPDLIPIIRYYRNEYVELYKAYVVIAKVKNIGTITSPPHEDCIAKVNLIMPIFGSLEHEIEISELDPGEEDFLFQERFIPAGSYIELIVDYNGVIYEGESGEQNNIYKLRLPLVKTKGTKLII